MAMMIPGNRLLFGYACMVIPLVAVSVLSDKAALICYALVAGAVVIFLGDALVCLRVCRGIEVVFPKIVRMSKGRKTTIPVRVRNRQFRRGRLRLGVLLSGKWFHGPYEQTIHLNPLTDTICEWPVTGICQGRTVLDRCYLEMPSKLGFWTFRTSLDIRCECRIYPDLSFEQKTLAAFFHRQSAGVHVMRYLGKGREFEKLREYMPGDSYEDIHWKATAKMGVPISKIFQMERTQNVYVLIDCSRMSARNAGINGQKKETILELQTKTALAIGLATQKMGDQWGLGMFSDTMEVFLPAGKGRAHFGACRDHLYTAVPRLVTPDFTECITFAAHHIKSRSLLIIFTSLDDRALADGFLKNIHVLSRKHMVLVCMIRPAPAGPVFHSDTVQTVDDLYVHLAGHMIWQSIRELELSLKRQSVGFCLSAKQTLSVDMISRYLQIKQRQVL